MNPPVYTALLAAVIFILIRADGFLSYAVQNPDAFRWGFFSSLGGFIADFIFAGVLMGGFLWIGRRIMTAFGFEQDNDEMNSELGAIILGMVLAVVLGEAVASLVLLFLGLAGLYHRPVFVLLFAALGFGAYRERTEMAQSIRWLLAALRQRIAPFQWLCVAALAVGIGRAAVANTAPPTDWDTLAYHLAFPKIYLAEGQFFRLPWTTNGHYPLGSEMIYLPALALDREMASHWINYFHALGVLALIYVFARRAFRAAEPRDLKTIGLMAAAIYAVQPAFRKVTGNAATDMNIALAMLAAVAVFLNKREQPGDESGGNSVGKRMLLCGLLTGIAMSLKLTGTWIALTLFIAIAIFGTSSDHEERFCATLKNLAIFCAGICVTGLVWYAKNWIWTGNPIWPYMSGLFGGTAADLDSWTRMKASITEGVPKNFLNFLMIPYHLVFNGNLFHYATQYLIAPFIALVILYRLRWAWSRMERMMLALIGVYLIIWFWVFQDWRYFLPMAALVSVLTAGWSVRLWRESEKMRRWGAVVAAAAILPIHELSANNEFFVFFNMKSKQAPGLSARERYLLGSLGPVYAVTHAANAVLPAAAKVYFYRDVRGYYLDRSYTWGDPLNPGVLSYRGIRDSAELERKLRELGYTHVLFNPYIGNYKGDQDYYDRADGLMEGVLRNAVRRAELEGVALYELKAI